MIPLEKLVRDKPAKVMFGEPCIGSGSSGSGSNSNRCLLCPKGSRCDDASWVPIPDVGYKSMPKEKSVLVSSSVGRRTGEIWDRRHSRAMFRATQGGLFPSKLVEIERLKC